MLPEEFLAIARDPLAWRAKAISLRRSADVVWEEFASRFVGAVDRSSKATDPARSLEATDVLRNCQFLYSLAAECALKGLLIKQQPKEVVFETRVDGTDRLIDASIRQIGSIRIDTHNLEKLAEISGMVEVGKNPELRELLEFSTFCINWIGRYPIPLNSDSDFMPRKKLPRIIFNHYYRDMMDPFLDALMAELDS
jgi:hypothetical protein